MYSNIGISFRETVPLNLFYIQNDLKIIFLTKKVTLVFLYVFLKIIKSSIYTLNSELLLQVHIRVGNVMIFFSYAVTRKSSVTRVSYA